MRVLWICNLVLPDFCGEFDIKRTVYGGWMTGLLNALKNWPDVEVALAFPIIDKVRRHDGTCQGHRYYSFAAEHDRQDIDDADCFDMTHDFLRIILDFQPDVVEIWGTEYPHAWAAFQACRELGLTNRIVCHLQGILTFIVRHYAQGLPDSVVTYQNQDGSSICQEINILDKQARRERKIIEGIGYVLGRTFWDESCAKLIFPGIRYRTCDEILRPEFYNNQYSWQAKRCERHTIFVSQASYALKGLHNIMMAASLLRVKFPDFHICLGGSNPMIPDSRGNLSTYGFYVKSLGERLGVLDRLEFMGMLTAEQMVEQYLHANAFVLASSIENSPNSVAEAMLIGTPVVASDVGGLSSLVRHGEDGFLYQADAPYMLAAYVERIFEDDRLAMRLSENGQKTMRERHSPARIREQVLSVYAEAAMAREAF